MRKLGFVFFILGLLLPQVLNGQDPCKNGLVFSDAFFIEMASAQSYDFIAVDSTIQVEKGMVWMITDARAFRISKDFYPSEGAISLMINDQVIHHQRSIFVGPVWLPEGQYEIRLHSDDKSERDNFRAYVTGVKYVIEE